MTPRQKLFQAMGAPLPVTTLGISAAADYLEREGDDLQIALQVYIDGDTPTYQESNGQFTYNLEIVTAVHDMSGKTVKVFTDSMRADLQSGQVAAAQQNGYRYYSDDAVMRLVLGANAGKTDFECHVDVSGCLKVCGVRWEKGENARDNFALVKPPVPPLHPTLNAPNLCSKPASSDCPM